MRYIYVGKNITVSDSLKEKTQYKLQKLKKFLPEDTEVTVNYEAQKIDDTIEVTIPMEGRLLRAEVSAESFEHALDDVVQVLQRQLREFKSRLRDQARDNETFRRELDMYFNMPGEENLEEDDEDGIIIERTKQFALKPIDAKEAVMEMELLGHDFYMFRNAITEEVNVIYKRKNGNYGLIEPDF